MKANKPLNQWSLPRIKGALTQLSNSWLVDEEREFRIELYDELERRVGMDPERCPCLKHGLAFANPRRDDSKYLNLRICPTCGWWVRKEELDD